MAPGAPWGDRQPGVRQLRWLVFRREPEKEEHMGVYGVWFHTWGDPLAAKAKPKAAHKLTPGGGHRLTDNVCAA